MSDRIKFKNTISTTEFCKLRESVGFQKLTEKQAETVLSKYNIYSKCRLWGEKHWYCSCTYRYVDGCIYNRCNC